jgi:AcrR family transcriptional regulator
MCTADLQPSNDIPRRPHGATVEPIAHSQDARIRAAMVAIVGERGYGPTTVEHVIRRAAVSRKTFYDLYASLADCFLGSFEAELAAWTHEIAAGYSAAKATEAEADPTEARVRAGLLALLDQVRNDPAGARLLLVEALACNPQGIRRVSDLVEELRELVNDALADERGEPQVPAVASLCLAAGIIELVANRAINENAEPLLELADLVDPLVSWVLSYRSTAARIGLAQAQALPSLSEPLWAKTTATTAAAGDELVASIRSPNDSRARIIATVIEIAGADGYAALSVNRIVESAHVSQRTFRRHFATAHDAFVAATFAGGEQTLTHCMPAVMAAPEWDLSVVAGLVAQTRFFAARPSLARFAFISLFGAGADVLKLRRMQLELWASALQPGFRKSAKPPHLIVAEAIGGGIFRAMHHCCVRHGPERLADLGPGLAHFALTPFIGAEAAAHTVRRYLATV